MKPIWLRTTNRQVEIGTVVVFFLLGVVLVLESIRLGPGWGVSGPDAGFFPFYLTVLLVLGISPFAWGKPVPVSPGNFRNPKRGMLLVAAAGDRRRHQREQREDPGEARSHREG